MKKYWLVDPETGEIVIDNFKVNTEEDIANKKKHAEKDRLKKEFKEFQQETLGYFIFFIFKNLDYLEELLTDAELVKLIYIATYVKDQGYLKKDNNVTFMKKEDLKVLLNTNDETFRVFYNKLVQSQLLLEDTEGKMAIDIDFFYRGKERTYKKLTGKKLADFSRVYIKTIRDLYINSDSKQHKKLAVIYKLLPYVNWKYNILCTNVNETNKDKIEAVSIKKIMDLLGYNSSNISRFRKEFYSLKYKEYQIFRTVQYTENYEDSFIIVNPLFYYRGDDLQELQTLTTLFGITTTMKVENAS